MDRTIAQAQLKSLGLTVSKAGVVSHGGYDYGVLRATDFQTMDGDYIALDDVASISWVEENRDLFFLDDDDGQRKAHANVYIPKDIEAIEIMKMPKTLLEVSEVFDSLYPDAEGKLYYDILNEYDAVDMSLFGEPGGMQAMNDKIFAFYLMDIQRRLREKGYVGTSFPSDRVLGQALDMYTMRHSRNLFREWVESHEWDGIPRVRTWFQKLFGATAPPLRDEGLEDRYLGDVSEMWFVGIVKRQYEAAKHEIVPVLISEQGIGKGNAIRLMAGKDCWYTESTQSVKHPDKFLDSVRGAVIVELSESKQLKDDDANALKSFISTISDRLRKPYARYNDVYARHFGFIATSNEADIFTDDTGNRRYFPMFCDPDLSEYVSDYDVEQVWAEALQMYHDGHLWFTSEDTADIASVMQDYTSVEDINVDMIDQWLDDPMNGYAEVGSKITRAVILDKVFGINPDDNRSLVPRSVQDMYTKWSRRAYTWERTAKPFRMDGKVVRGWERIAPPGTRKKQKRLRSNNRSQQDDNTPVGLMRRHCQQMFGRIPKADEVFPVDGLTADEIDALQREGMIYDSGYKNGQIVYRVGVVL